MEQPEPSTEDILRYINTNAPGSAIGVVHSCAESGAPYWRLLFAAGFCEQIAKDHVLENEFLARLCKSPALPHAPVIMDAYLARMSKEHLARLFSPSALKRKAHPANECFYGASFMTGDGPALLKMLEVLIQHGLPLTPIAVRNAGDLERCASLAHREFLKVVVPRLEALDDSVIRCVMTKSDRPADAISALIDDCAIPIERFTTSKMMSSAQPQARAYLNAKLARMDRTPQSVITEDEESCSE